jgi:molecular chaperone DnaK (HSP70)
MISYMISFSARFQMLRLLRQEFFNGGKELNKSINPDEAVTVAAYGAMACG